MMTGRHFAMALSLSVLLGAGWIFGKTATSHFPPILVAALRFGTAGLVIVSLFGWPGVKLHRLLPVSTCAISLPYGLSYIGLSQLDVSVTVLLIQLEAPILIVLSAIVLKEIPGNAAAIGVALAVLGVVFVAGRPTADGHYMAVLVLVVSMVVWAVGQILVRRLGLDGGGLKLLGALSTLATPQLLFLTLVAEEGHAALLADASVHAWLQVVYLGVVMTVIGIGTWYFLVARYPLHLVAPFLLLVPVFSVAGGVAFLGERLDAFTVLGGTLILIGVAIATIRPPQRGRLDAAREP